MSQKLAKALIIPLPDNMSKEQLKNLDPNKIKDKIELDFNPETLSINVQNGQEKDRSRKGRQETQFVGNTNTTLSFQAIFDNTRPNSAQNKLDPQLLDVRLKTSKIANLMQSHKRKGKKRSPKRMRFSWGTIIFDGLIKSYSETLDYFSADGIPLRSKVSISITEKKFLYEVDAESIESEKPATNNAPTNTDTQNNNFNVNANLGINANLAITANAGVDISNQQAIDVFGGAVIDSQFSADMDLGLVPGIAEIVTELNDIRPSTSWAPDGPKEGTSASELASLINKNRSTSTKTNTALIGKTEFSATSIIPKNNINESEEKNNPSLYVGNTQRPIKEIRIQKLLPIRGSPPITQGVYGSDIKSVFVNDVAVGEEIGERRPSWETVDNSRIDDSEVSKKVCCPEASYRKW